MDKLTDRQAPTLVAAAEYAATSEGPEFTERVLARLDGAGLGHLKRPFLTATLTIAANLAGTNLGALVAREAVAS